MNSNNVSVLIVGGSPQAPSSSLLQALALQADYIVACDSGADACMNSHIAINVLIGDNDSISSEALQYVKNHDAVIQSVSSKKDETDLTLAINYAREKLSCTRLVLTGISGARPDHALAALGCAQRASDLHCSIEEDEVSIYVLDAQYQNTWTAGTGDIGRTISVVPITPDTVISEFGFEWEISNMGLQLLDDHGISNTVIQNQAKVSVHSGCALLYVLRKKIVNA